MNIQELTSRLQDCETTNNSMEIDHLLSDVIRHICQNEWHFLLDINYPFETVGTKDIKNGNLVISKVVLDDYFSLMKEIPIAEILSEQIDTKNEVENDEKLSYIRMLIPLIPQIF